MQLLYSAFCFTEREKGLLPAFSFKLYVKAGEEDNSFSLASPTDERGIYRNSDENDIKKRKIILEKSWELVILTSGADSTIKES